MVRVLRTPRLAKGVFSANQLSGWPDGVHYTPYFTKAELREKRRQARQRKLLKSQVVIVVSSAAPVLLGAR